MKPKITVITLAVRDLKKSVRFYRDGLGFPTDGIIGEEFEYGAVAFFDLENGLRLALWPESSIAHDTWLPASAPSHTRLTLWHNVGSEEEVDRIMELAERAWATITKRASKTFYGGYGGYFQDLDGHLWDVVYNPGFE